MAFTRDEQAPSGIDLDYGTQYIASHDAEPSYHDPEQQVRS
jgi:hypothetical protein